jgi:hypothetical protein
MIFFVENREFGEQTDGSEEHLHEFFLRQGIT